MRGARAAARARTALAGAGVVALCLGAACEPREIYLFDRERAAPRADAGVEPLPSEPRDEPLPPRVPEAIEPDLPSSSSPRQQPACLSSACDACVAQTACAVDGASMFCHPQTARCSLACDPEAPPGRAGNCPAAESCEPRLGLCVACASNADCTGTLPVCDRQRNECVECAADADCGVTGEVCLPGAQRCVQCRDDLDCRGQDDAIRCLPGEQRCVECVDDRDCTADPDKPLCSSRFECDDRRDDDGSDD